MNNRFLTIFVVAVAIIVVVVLIILGILFHFGPGSSATATATPASSAGGITIHNDTNATVTVQDCTGALVNCGTANMGSNNLAPGISGTEHGATGVRILNAGGGVVGCIALTSVTSGSTVNVSTARACQ